MKDNPVLIEVTRGDGVESTHRGAVAVMDGAGNLVIGRGQVERPIYPRSAIKPIQALMLVESGAADHFDVSDEELALACASHSGQPMHVDRVERWLDRMGLGPDDLECGAHPPRRESDVADLVRAGREPGRSHNNCSGKHAGFLSSALHMGEPTRGYVKSGHPVQQRLKSLLSEMASCDLSATSQGVDGCGIPVMAMPLAAMARALAAMANPAELSEQRGQASRRILGAMTSHPQLVGGSDRFDTRMMAAATGGFAIKTGAEGVYAGILPGPGLGIALKIDDGALRASETVMASLLGHLGQLQGAVMEPVADLMEPVLINTTGEAVGRVRPVMDWR